VDTEENGHGTFSLLLNVRLTTEAELHDKVSQK
jgi:hypothetical protein